MLTQDVAHSEDIGASAIKSLAGRKVCKTKSNIGQTNWWDLRLRSTTIFNGSKHQPLERRLLNGSEQVKLPINKLLLRTSQELLSKKFAFFLLFDQIKRSFFFQCDIKTRDNRPDKTMPGFEERLK